MTSASIGIDLGGTKTELVVLGSDSKEYYRLRRPTPAENYERIIHMLVEMVAEAEQHLQASGKPTPVNTIGIGTPGALNSRDLMKNSNTVVMNGRPFVKDLQQALKRDVAIANDANCFALSEATDGAGSDASSVFGVIIGTGTGGGIVINGQLLQGANAIAGEWGHNPLPWPNQKYKGEGEDGPPCYCGKQSCIETFLSGPGLSQQFLQLSNTDATDRATARTTARATAESIVALARQQDDTAVTVLTMYFDRMARALAQVINILDPDVIVLGGGMSNIEEIYQIVPTMWSQYIFSDTVKTRLVKAQHGDSSGVRGAAWLAS